VSKSNSFETDFLELLFNATTIANVADDAGTSPITAIQVSLHTSDVGEAGDQTTNEANYTNYGRIGQARTSGGWTVTGNAVENNGAVTFATAGSSQAVTHFALGRDNSGAGQVFYYGALGATLNVANGITPEFASGDIDVTED
jgi:hypothetical protein